MSSRSSTFLLLGILTVIFGITFTVFVIPAGQKAEADEDAAARTATTLLRALGRGDGVKACAVLTKPAAATLAAQQGEEDCISAVRELAQPLTSAQRRTVAATTLTDDDTRAQKKETVHHVRLGGNPFGYTKFYVDRQDDEWRVVRME